MIFPLQTGSGPVPDPGPLLVPHAAAMGSGWRPLFERARGLAEAEAPRKSLCHMFLWTVNVVSDRLGNATLCLSRF